MDNWTVILALWGAILSTVIAIVQLFEYRLRLVRQIRVSTAANPPFEALKIEVTNAGPRPVTVKKILILYAGIVEAGQ